MSIFNTTANTEFNSFQDPFNPMNLNRGPWGIDPNYLTPAHDAPYRPPYSGGERYISEPNPGFFRSAYGISPFYTGTPYGVGTHDQESIFYSQLGQKAQDFGPAAMQRIGLPLFAFGGAIALGNKLQVSNRSSAVVQMARQNWYEIFGTAPSEAAHRASRVSMWAGMGQRFGAGMAGGLNRSIDRFGQARTASIRARALASGATAAQVQGMSSVFDGFSRSAVGRTAAATATTAAGIASSLVLPALAAEGVIRTANKMVFDPYVAVRESSNLLRRNFEGITFGTGDGDLVTGGGLSRRSASRIGTQIARIGVRDQVFNEREVNSITDMAGQMGLMDNVMPDMMANRAKNIIKQVKMVMSIAGTTDFKEAINIMAKLHTAGADVKDVQGIASRIGALSSAAGVSATRMMNTVGMQGQYLFQANGLTPYLGQIQAATSAAGFATAFRSGLISPDLLARLGGWEGASQLSVTGQVNSSQTLYNQMRLFNQYVMNRKPSGDVVNNVTQFGQEMASNPYKVFGSMILNRGALISEQFKKEGVKAVQDQLLEIAKLTPMALDKDGKLDEKTAATILVKRMGLGEQEAIAILEEIRAGTDTKTVEQKLAGMRKDQVKMMKDIAEQTGSTRIAAAFSPITKTYRDVRESITSAIGGGVETGSGIIDRAQRAISELQFGSYSDLAGRRLSEVTGESARNVGFIDETAFDRKLSLKDPAENARQLERVRQQKADPKFQEAKKEFNQFKSEFQAINMEAKRGKPAAMAVLNRNLNTQDLKNAVYKAAKDGIIDKKYATDVKANEELAGAIQRASRRNEDLESKLIQEHGELFTDEDGLFVPGPTKSIKGTKGLEDTMRGSRAVDALDQREAIEASFKVLDKLTTDGSLDRNDLQTRTLLEIIGRNVSGVDIESDASLREKTSKVVKMAQTKGITTRPLLMEMGGRSAVIKLAKDEKTRSQIFEPGSTLERDFLMAWEEKDYDTATKAISAAINSKVNAPLIESKLVHVNENMTDEARVALGKSNAARAEEEQKIEALRKAGVIKFSDEYSMKSSVRMDDAAKDLKDAARELTGAAKHLSEIKPEQFVAKEGSGWAGWLKKEFPGMSQTPKALGTNNTISDKKDNKK